MKYLVLVSHGGLAEGLKTSLAMFAGKMDQVIAADSKKKTSWWLAVDFEIFQDWPADDCLVLADIVGGSPQSTAATAPRRRESFDGGLILGGEPHHGLWQYCDEGCVDVRRFVSYHLIRSTIHYSLFEVSATSAEEDDDLYLIGGTHGIISVVWLDTAWFTVK